MIGTAFLVEHQGVGEGDYALLNFRGQQCISADEFKHVRRTGLGVAAKSLPCAAWGTFSTAALERVAATRPRDQPFGWQNAATEARAEMARRQREGDDSAALLASRNAAIEAEKQRRTEIVVAQLPAFLDNEAVYRTPAEGARANANLRFAGFLPANFADLYQAALRTRWGGQDPSAPDFGMDGHD